MGQVQPRSPVCLSEGKRQSLALRDLDQAVATEGDWPADRARFRIERGKVRQAVGDILGAYADFEAAIAADPAGRLARAARLDRARLFAQVGALRRARAEYDVLLDTSPSDRTARLARARLAMRQGRAAEAEADLTRLLNDEADLAPKARADLLASRALARLSVGRIAEAEADAEEALRLDSSPSHERIRARVALGAGRPIDDRLLRPDAIGDWPVGGPSLVADLHAAIDRLRPATTDPAGPTAVAALRARAAMFSALGEDAAAVSEADRAVDRVPSVVSYALRAEVRLRAGDRSGALSDAERGLACDRDAPSLLALRGRLAIAAGHPDEALRWLNPGCLFRRSRCGRSTRGEPGRSWTWIIPSKPLRPGRLPWPTIPTMPVPISVGPGPFVSSACGRTLWPIWSGPSSESPMARRSSLSQRSSTSPASPLEWTGSLGSSG